MSLLGLWMGQSAPQARKPNLEVSFVRALAPPPRPAPEPPEVKPTPAPMKAVAPRPRPKPRVVRRRAVPAPRPQPPMQPSRRCPKCSLQASALYPVKATVASGTE